MTTNKTTVASLVEICAQKGISKIVLSPGSRNSPLAIAFNRHPKIKCYVIVDERAAAFFAMGIAQQTGETVAIACTSGSAALNYAPAIVEAFYQKIPLLILTADRPVEWINQAAGQTIQQRDIYINYILKSYELTQEAKEGTDDLWYNDRLVNEAINLSQAPQRGPVHINIPLREPLYGLVEKMTHVPKIQALVTSENTLSKATLENLITTWTRAKGKLILCGLMEENPALNETLEKLCADPSVSVLTETTANLYSPKFNPCIDRLISTIGEENEKQYIPEILVTIGGAVISKKIKALFRKYRPAEHWHFDLAGEELDTYQSLTKTICTRPEYFFGKLLEAKVKTKSDFQKVWKQRDKYTHKQHRKFLKQTEYSDFKAYQIILEHIPKGSNFQMGNSAGVRYVQLFNQRKNLTYHANRGTSGIDGSTSTAIGAAVGSGKPTTIVCGDLSFFYDSNALWNKYIPADFRIIIINNSGGGIFRIIPGPSTSEELDDFFEVTQQRSAKFFAKMYNISYLKVESVEELGKALPKFYKKKKRAGILEVFTPRKANDKILGEYFEFLR